MDDDIVLFNLSGDTFPFNAPQRAKTIATFIAKKDEERQETWQNLESRPFQRCEPNPDTMKQLPVLLRGLAGLDKYRVRKELFDKKFLKKLTGLNYI